MEYHVPVLLEQSLEGLHIKPNGVYVDATFGGGGHSKELLEQLGDEGKLFAFDQDEDAAKVAEELNDPRFKFIEGNFRHIKKYLKLFGAKKVEGILADLGVSSHQLDEEERGFSLRFDGKLDMRMSREQKLSAYEVLNEYEEEALTKLFWEYGEIKRARVVAGAIVKERNLAVLETTQHLRKAVEGFAPKGKEHKFLAQVFQAVRLEVNDEMGALKEFLKSSGEIVEEGGRLVVIAYHSLEDRLVKNYMRNGKFSGEVEKDFYGNMLRPFRPMPSRAIKASEEEIGQNRRARSARLRIAERLAEIKKQ